MTEEMRHEIVQRRQSGMSLRAIAEELGISRGAVYRALARVQAQRDGRTALSPRARKRGSIIDSFEPILKELLAKYPNLTVERAWQELRARGYTGGYTVVRERVRLAAQFLDGLLAKQIQGKLQAQQLLALLAHYQRADVLKALERAVRFGAFSLAAMRRILAATAKPKPLLDELAELYKDALDPSLREEPIGPRPTSDYQHLLSPEETDEPPSKEKSQDDTECA